MTSRHLLFAPHRTSNLNLQKLTRDGSLLPGQIKEVRS
jgi:hypothetical protein